jgi:hypothetical protein
MKILALALLLLTTSDVVDVARTAKAKRRKSTTRVLTNTDVKKSKGTVVQTSAKPAPIEGQPEPTLVEQQEAMRRANAVYDAKYKAAKSAVDELEKELAEIEQAYYDENDLDRRDGEMVRRFDATRKKLDAARKVFANLTP